MEYNGASSNKNYYVTKESGETELFSEEKLRRSLKRAKATPESIEYVVKHVRRHLRDGIKTKEIYRHAFSMLRREQRRAAVGYGIKRALFALGPSGHPFEHLVGEILKVKGFDTEVGVMVRGRCVEHEVDVVAKKDKHQIMVECKFHNRQGVKSDIKTALYVKARFEDIEKCCKMEGGEALKFHEAWLVTNTRLTADAVKYANCAGLKAISWDYPESGNLQQLIEQSGMYPVTVLTTLTKAQKERLVANNVVICRDIAKKLHLLEELGISKHKAEDVLEEMEYLRGLDNGQVRK